MARHKQTSRTTPKGTTPSPTGDARPGSTYQAPSPTWVPVVMSGLLAGGIVLILLNYTIEFLGMPSNWYLLGGLGLVLGGIIAATQYR